MATVLAHDAIHLNVPKLPKGQTAGYTTGSPSIKWTAGDWQAHPQAVRICQDSGTDHTADVLDVERGAATNAQAPIWFKAAVKAYQAADRPGQRSPAVYCSASNVTPLVNAFIASGIKSGCGLWVANWNLSQAQAEAEVEAAGGPFPVIGVQYSNGPLYDFDVFDAAWLGRVSAKAPAGRVWQDWHSDGRTSLAQLGADLGMWPSHILAATGDHRGGTLDDVSAGYVTAVFKGDLAPGEPIPRGATLRVLK